MMDELISIYNHTDYDFRHYSYPSDKFLHLFNKWVDYYRMNFTIAKMIRLMSILEIGVRYGYSAITSHKALENATSLIINKDSNSSRWRNKEAGNWANEITKNYSAKFLLANNQSVTNSIICKFLTRIL